jgi:thymidine phosphorylase
MFEKVGHTVGMHIHVEITDGSEPIGNGIGPALEARDVLWVLGNYPQAPQDLRKKAIKLAGHIMTLYPLPYWKAGHGMKYARHMLDSGKAYDAMKRIIAAQGKRIDDPAKIKVGKWTYRYTAWKDGTVKSMSNKDISRIAKIAGAPADAGAGLFMHKHVGDKVKKREPIFTVYADGKQKLEFAKTALKHFEGVEIKD